MYKHRTLLSALLLAGWLLEPALSGPAEDQFAVAGRHYSRQRWELAAAEFRTFLDQFPQHQQSDTVVFLLGESLVQLQEFREARSLFVKFLDRAPQHRFAPQASFRAGETAFLIGDHDAARRALGAFHQAHPQHSLNAYALAYLGEIALAADDGPAAETVFRQALEQFQSGPLDVECRFGMARALELQGKREEALRFYQFLADHHQGPLADDAQLRTGLLFHETGQYERAANALAVIETSYPDSPLLVESLYWLGATQLAQGNPGAARRTLQRAYEADAKHELADAVLFSLAEAARQTGDLASATSTYQRLLDSAPDSPWADDAAQVLVSLAFDQNQLSAVHHRAAEFTARYATSPLLSSVLQTDGRAYLKEQAYQAAIGTFEQLLAEPGGHSASPGAEAGPAAREAETRRATRYYLGLAYLGAERYADALKVLETVQPKPHERQLLEGVAVARAFALVALKQYAAAIEPLRRYLAAQPEGADAADCRAKLVVALAETGQLDEAQRMHTELQQFNRAHPLFLPTTEYLAQLAQSRQEHELAHRLFQLLAQDGNPPEFVAKGLSALGKLQMDAGDEVQSAATFAQLIAVAPESSQAAEAALLRGQLLQSQQQDDAALATYYAAIELYPDAKQTPYAMFAAARLHARLRQYPEARTLLETLIQQYATFPQQDAALYQLAWVLIELGQDRPAEAAFARLVREHRGSDYWADSTYRLAHRASEDQQYERAGTLLDELLAGDVEPQILAHALYLKGQLAANQERWQLVIPPLQRIVDELPASALRAPAEYWIAEAQYRLGNYDEAEAILVGLDQATQGEQAAWLAMVPLRRAQVHAQKNEWQAAHEIAAGIAARFPQFRQQHEVDYLLGRCLTSEARLAEAREAYERVIRSPTGGRTETAAMAQWMIGETHFHQQAYEQAIRAYHRVESLYAYPRWQAAALLQAGKCHELLGQWRQAVQLYAQLLQEHPDTGYADDASQRLQVAQQHANSNPQN